MEKVQNLKSSNTAPSSKTFRNELHFVVQCYFIKGKTHLISVIKSRTEDSKSQSAMEKANMLAMIL
jgi:hypothetical protein